MKCVILLFAAMFFIPLAAKAEDLDNSKIYNFYQPTCPHCHEAINYLNAAYPDLKLELIDITAGRENMDLFIKCAKKFNLGNQVGTPLFCMGAHYIMGWSKQEQQNFDEYVKDFF